MSAISWPKGGVVSEQGHVVVTGANGWLGRALVARLAAPTDGRADVRVVAVARDHLEGRALTEFASTFPSANIDIRFADFGQPGEFDQLFSGLVGPIEVVHTAGVIHPRHFSEFERVNADGTRKLAAAARRAGVVRFVHVSSNSPFGVNAITTDRFRQIEPYHPYLEYGRTKMLGELAILDEVERGLYALIVRPPWFYGPFQPARQTTFFSMVKSGRFPVFGAGDQHRSMVFVENLVDGILATRNWTGPAGHGWWVADREPYTVAEIVHTVGRALADEGHDVQPPRLNLPDFVGNVAEKADRILQKSRRYVQQVHVLGEMNKTIACDISATTRDLGYEPRVDLYEGMRRSIRWCAANGIEL